MIQYFDLLPRGGVWLGVWLDTHLEQAMESDWEVWCQGLIHAMRVQVGGSRVQHGGEEGIERNQGENRNVEHPVKE